MVILAYEILLNNIYQTPNKDKTHLLLPVMFRIFNKVNNNLSVDEFDIHIKGIINEFDIGLIDQIKEIETNINLDAEAIYVQKFSDYYFKKYLDEK